MSEQRPVASWATDYDIFDPDYVRDPTPMWDGLRGTCPVPSTERWGGSFMPVTYKTVSAVAHDTAHFSSRDILVVPPVNTNYESVGAPPITSDAPEHTWARRLILPAFSPKATAEHEPYTRQLCRELIAGLVAQGKADAATDYAQQIPPRVIAKLIGVDPDMAGEFTEWVRGVLELGLQDPELRLKYRTIILDFLVGIVMDRRENPRDDLVSWLMAQEVDGRPVPNDHIVGTLNLLLIAGIDTTWSSIGSALWHLATHPEDRRRLVAEPELIPTAIEELLRAYSPVTMARVVSSDVTFEGCPMAEGDKVLLSFPAANRDPEQFENADTVIIDRAHNRHVAFGVGIHRCAGSNLARMEMNVAIEEWLAAVPEFSLEPGTEVTWAGGQVRGPRVLPVVFG